MRRCRHGRTQCWDSVCKAVERKAVRAQESNVGSASLNTDGNLALGIGGGLAVDLSDGSLGMQVGGVTFDSGSSFSSSDSGSSFSSCD